MTSQYHVTVAKNYTLAAPRIVSLSVENLDHTGEWFEGDIVLEYDLFGGHIVRGHFKTKDNAEVEIPVGPISAKVKAKLVDTHDLTLTVSVCVNILGAKACSPEYSINVTI